MPPHPCAHAMPAGAAGGQTGLEKSAKEEAVLKRKGQAQPCEGGLPSGAGFEDDISRKEREELTSPLCSTGCDFRIWFPHLFSGLVITLQGW